MLLTQAKRLTTILLAAFALSACQAPMVSNDAVRGTVGDVTGRHDAYVQADGELSQGQKQAFIGESATLRGLVSLEEGETSGAALKPLVYTVGQRHDDYITGDLHSGRVDDLTARVWLRSSQLLRDLVTEVTKAGPLGGGQ